MNISFSTRENKKAAIYTSIICVTLLLIFLLIKWDINLPIEPIVQDQIEINLGNRIFYIERNKLFMIKVQTFRMKSEGIAKINEENIYDISIKGDIIINIFIDT